MQTRDSLRNVHFVLIAAPALLLAFIFRFVGARPPYFFGPSPFFIAGIVCAALALFAWGLRRQQIEWVAAHVSALFTCYGFMEIVFATVILQIPLPDATSAWRPFGEQVNGYWIDRSYQYIAIVLLFWCVSWFYSEGRPHYLRIGDLGATTQILGGPEPMTWQRVLGRIGAMIVALGAVGVILRGQQSIPVTNWSKFAGMAIGGFNNSLIEELVFRGILLASLATRLSPSAANWFQAALFSVIHYSCIPEWTLAAAGPEIGRLVMYLGIGWLLGRATQDTRGIGVSTMLHFLITTAIWANVALVVR